MTIGLPVVIFGEEQLDPIISGGDEIGLFIMGNHHPGNHVVPQGNREGIRIRHIKENAGVTQNNPHAGRLRQNGALCKQLLFARVFLIDQHQNFLKELKSKEGERSARSLQEPRCPANCNEKDRLRLFHESFSTDGLIG